ncbi:MAG TPA: GreA/GreB family elongation factor [Candidatus Saccharimonadales bacterium]|nr:GreA/GreB family elongation factor [Candidatus Saccharimonadales bacterium]
MKEEFEKLASTGKLTRQNVDALVLLTESGYCWHRSWGFGKITTVDTVFSRFVIDFQSKAGHTMDLAFAADSLKPIPSEHIYARKVSDLDALRQMAALHHLDLIKVVLQSFGGRATVEQIQQALVPDVIKDDWKKWWEAAKRELKKDGHFQVPLKKSEPIIYQAKEVSMQDRFLVEFRAAKGLKARLTVAQEVLKNLSDLTDPAAASKEVIAALNAEIATHQRTQAAVALEAIFVRDELRDTASAPAPEGDITARSLWLQETSRVGSVLEQMPAAKHRRALQSFKEATPDRWIDALLGALNHVSAKLAGEIAHALISGGKLAELKELLARLISQHQASTELLLWLAKERSDSFADILGPEVFRAMLTAMERDQFNERRSNKLRDFILADQTLLVELIGSADLEVIKDLTRALQLSPCFDDMDKRSLLARIVKSYPAVQTMISGEQTKQDTVYLVSWESLERRKNEYAELVQKAIPANSKEIAVARSYGDLRENHEYKAAKEMQKILMRRKSELENQLVRARGTDFANPRTDVVSIATIVAVTDLDQQQGERFTILGAWDSDPDKGIISYLTPVGQTLLNHKSGDEVEVQVDGGKKRYRIDSITAYTPVAEAVVSPAG